MNEKLVIIILEQLAFLELSNDNVIDPDIAVQQMENISAVLNELADGDKKEFIRMTKAYADQQKEKDRLKFFQELPENSGLI